MLPTCLLPAQRPVLSLMGMSEHEFYELFIGDGQGVEFEEPDIQVIEAFNDLVEERAHALIHDWQHREAVIDLVSCFAPLASGVPALDLAITEVSRWLCGIGPRTTLRACGTEFQVAEALVAQTSEAMADDPEGGGFGAYSAAVQHAATLAKTYALHLAFDTLWIDISLQGDRVRVTIDLPEEGEVDMGGHHWDGDEDADAGPVTPPLETV
jgi:hypothetical protein